MLVVGVVVIVVSVVLWMAMGFQVGLQDSELHNLLMPLGLLCTYITFKELALFTGSVCGWGKDCLHVQK